MKNLKFTLILLTGLLAAGFSNAQSIEDGKKFMYYEKFISAKNVFQQLLTANPNNEEAAYWLGQAMIGPDEDKDIAGARAVYEKGLAANANSALLNAGLGHVELLEGKTQQARSHFESAISLSGGKNIMVLDAVGFANADFDSKYGDAAYAVEKLKLATTQKGFKDARIMTDLGDAYRKLQDGGNAQTSYEAALAMDPKYARAKFRIGRIYQSQGRSQEGIYLQYYNDAIALDPNYAPVYFYLHQYYYETDVVKSAGYLDKYLAAKGATDEPNTCFLKAQMIYAQGKFEETVTAAEACLTGNANPYPNLFGLLAYANFKIADKLEKAGDSTGAIDAYAKSKIAFDKYLNKQKAAKIGPRDKVTYALVLLKFPGNEALAGSFMEQAVLEDTLEINKVAYLTEVAKTYEKRKQYAEAGEWYKKILNVKKTPTKTDIYNAANSYYRVGQFAKSADLYTVYTQKYPEDIFGYYMIGKSLWGIDTVMKYGLANNAFAKAIEVGEAYPDKSKIISQLMGSYKYMFAYNVNVLKNKEVALAYADKAIALDPNDAEIKGNRDIIAPANLKPDTKPANTADKVVINPDGSLNVTGKDGSSTVITNTGKITTVKDGITTIIENGKVTMLDANGKVINTPTPPRPGAGTPKPPTKPAGGTKKK
ncbi:MAG: tetratricopeptide repeat protein [Ferruginibacter sp.]|nr:tetratricopeptide repeat protein [Ferruginibacter sp.]